MYESKFKIFASELGVDRTIFAHLSSNCKYAMPGRNQLGPVEIYMQISAVVSRLKFAVAAPPLAQARSSDMADSVGNLSSNGK